VFDPKPAGWPGLALAAGASMPFSFGAFSDEVWTGYGYAAVTQAPTSDDTALFHANLGVVHADFEDARNTSLIWAGGSQLRMAGDFFCFAEPEIATVRYGGHPLANITLTSPAFCMPRGRLARSATAPATAGRACGAP
jgi:hypothetical protein